MERIPWNKGIKVDRTLYPTMGHFTKHSEKTKAKISDVKRENPTRYWLDKKRPDISKKAKVWVNERLADHQYKNGHEGMKGKDNPKWAGGITPKNTKIRNSKNGVKWKNDVFARDNWTCQKCGQRGGDLNAHHIKPFAEFPKLRFDLDNGITLCKPCHKKEHNTFASV